MTASLEQALAPRSGGRGALEEGEGGCLGASPAAAGARVPDFFIVGNPKSGTTALYEMLRRHPDIFMPALKEPHFLAAEEPPSNSLPRTLDEYLALFAAARPNQRAGEASPSYLRSPVAAGRIVQLAPDARIVAILREPASFVRSLHLQYLQDHVETERDLRGAIAKEEIVRDGRTVLRYSERVRYVEQLRRFHELFGRDRVLVLIYDDFRADNEATVRRVLRFLEVDDGVSIPPLEANPTVRMRSVRLARLTLAVRTGRGPLGRALNGSIRALTSERMRAGAMRVVRGRLLYGAPQPPDESLMLELRRRFAPEVVALSEYLDRDLVAEWGYAGP
jgi:sulfotransferase family protein